MLPVKLACCANLEQHPMSATHDCRPETIDIATPMTVNDQVVFKRQFVPVQQAAMNCAWYVVAFG